MDQLEQEEDVDLLEDLDLLEEEDVDLLHGKELDQLEGEQEDQLEDVDLLVERADMDLLVEEERVPYPFYLCCAILIKSSNSCQSMI